HHHRVLRHVAVVDAEGVRALALRPPLEVLEVLPQSVGERHPPSIPWPARMATGPPPDDQKGKVPVAELAASAKDCQACDLYKTGTQTVFGEGGPKSKLMFVGEQPGDQEDRSGHPFVGPAGKLLDRALEEAGIDRSRVYVTNAVKHFKWVQSGKRRLHQKPNASEVAACRGWLEA